MHNDEGVPTLRRILDRNQIFSVNVMDSDDTDSYYCDCGIRVLPMTWMSCVDKEEESADDGGYEESDSVNPVISRHQRNYTILESEDIMQRQADDIVSISNVLNISGFEACALLCYYNWDVNRVHEEWFPDEERVRKTVGILEITSSKHSRSWTTERFLCEICCESRYGNQKLGASCGHPFCIECWKTYISVSINDSGIGCLRLKCPEPSCPAIVGFDMIHDFGSESDISKYQKYLIRSYVEGSKKRKWCPAPGCENAVEYEAGISENYDVNCYCGHKFCWNCTDEAHRPLGCEMVAKWYEKNSNEADNTTWINAFTKPCPRCNQPIEKNQGCNHMTCRSPCEFEFCWSCLGAWDEHGGSLYECNRYTQAMSEEDRRKDIVKKDLERYAHYYERWASNDKSQKLALADLHEARKVHVHKFARIQGEPDVQLVFVTEAWEQIVECRRVLKWSYAYGYFTLEDGSGKMRLFEHLQGVAEISLERLHHCAEKELMEKYNNASGQPLPDFTDFRSNMVHLTQVTREFFENLVTTLENNLSEVS